ncbi:nickel-binding protein [Armatimonas sp.]|uniref:nickel-binding protein n=1 Tax=Armatimonas sp. TaxID=1872638 RepID=UPI00286ABE3A|nr:nickel-binding protein [Armatimonas sp.]
MPRFLSVHTFPPGTFTPERIEEIAARGQHDSVVRGYRSFHSPAEGQIVWILEAPNKEAVLDFCQRMGLPVDAVTQLELEGHVGVIRSAEPAD